MHLQIKTSDRYLIDKYSNHSTYHDGDSGYDLFCTYDLIVKSGETIQIDLQIQCRALVSPNWTDWRTSSVSYYLYPRSSISKTPLRMSNSVGIIDSGYRGNIIATVDNIKGYDYKINKGDRLFQICSPDLKPFTYELVNELDSTSRGSGGFGSTN